MRKVNDYTGITQLHVPGVGDVPIRFDWKSIADMKSEFGDNWSDQVQEILQSMDVAGMANILSFSSDKQPDWWMKNSPPVVISAAAIQKALEASFFGPQAQEDRKSADPLSALKKVIRSLFPSSDGSNLGADQKTSGV